MRTPRVVMRLSRAVRLRRMSTSMERPTNYRSSTGSAREWKTVDDVWNDASNHAEVPRTTGFKSLEEMLEYGREKKRIHLERAEKGLPPLEKLGEDLKIPKHEVLAAIQDADNELLLVPSTQKFIAKMAGEHYLPPVQSKGKAILDKSSEEEEEEEDELKGKFVFEEISRATKLAEKLEKLLPVEVEIENRVYQKVTKGGNKLSFSYLFVAGNARGYAGWGYGKSPDSAKTKDRANIDLLKNLMFVPLYENRTIYNKALYAKFQGVKIYLWRRSPGFGVTAAPIIRLILKAFGITDVSIKMHGTLTRSSVVKCMFKVLAKVTCYTTERQNRGKVNYDPDGRSASPPTYKQMKDQQIRIRRIIGEIPTKYGIPMLRDVDDHFSKSIQVIPDKAQMDIQEQSSEYVMFETAFKRIGELEASIERNKYTYIYIYIL
ncbi:hypothetical protein AAMO2058_000532500 [Amorphochlora amoebiformis]